MRIFLGDHDIISSCYQAGNWKFPLRGAVRKLCDATRDLDSGCAFLLGAGSCHAFQPFRVSSPYKGMQVPSLHWEVGASHFPTTLEWLVASGELWFPDHVLELAPASCTNLKWNSSSQ